MIKIFLKIFLKYKLKYPVSMKYRNIYKVQIKVFVIHGVSVSDKQTSTLVSVLPNASIPLRRRRFKLTITNGTVKNQLLALDLNWLNIDCNRIFITNFSQLFNLIITPTLIIKEETKDNFYCFYVCVNTFIKLLLS